MHNFVASVSDPKGQACSVKVTVHLIDINDNPPAFDEAIKIGRNQVRFHFNNKFTLFRNN